MNSANPPVHRRPNLLILGRLERNVPRHGRMIVRESLNLVALCPACGKYHIRPFRYDDIEDLARVDIIAPDHGSHCPISRAGYAVVPDPALEVHHLDILADFVARETRRDLQAQAAREKAGWSLSVTPSTN